MYVTLAARALAGGSVSSGVEVYDDEWISVVVPATRIEHEGERWRVGAGYLADVVSGATQVVTADTISGATRFSDERHQMDASLTAKPGPEWSVGGAYTLSTEHDYTSHSFAPRFTHDLFQRMSTLELGYALSIERVGTVQDPDLVDRGQTHQADVAWRQIFGRSTSGALLFTGAYARCGENWGCLASPYRYVPVVEPDGTWVAVPEHNPEALYRGAVGARLAQGVGQSSSVLAGYRFYLDSWRVRAHTVDLSLSQRAFDERFLGRLVGRWSDQQGASFYQDTYASNDALVSVPDYRSLDRDLSPLSSWTAGGRVEWSWHEVGPLVRLGVSGRLNRMWYRYPSFSELPVRNAWVGGGGIDAEF